MSIGVWTFELRKGNILLYITLSAVGVGFAATAAAAAVVVGVGVIVVVVFVVVVANLSACLSVCLTQRTNP